MLKHALVFISLYWSKAYFLKKANFLQICIFKGIGQLYRKDVNVKMSVINKYILFVKYFGWKKGPELVYFIYRSIHT